MARITRAGSLQNSSSDWQRASCAPELVGKLQSRIQEFLHPYQGQTLTSLGSLRQLMSLLVVFGFFPLHICKMWWQFWPILWVLRLLILESALEIQAAIHVISYQECSLEEGRTCLFFFPFAHTAFQGKANPFLLTHVMQFVLPLVVFPRWKA